MARDNNPGSGAPSRSDGAAAERRWADTMGEAHPPTVLERERQNRAATKAVGAGPPGPRGRSPWAEKARDVPRLPAAVLELAARRALEGRRGGRHRSPFHGSAVEFSDHRAYQPGDDLRHLDWRLLARRDQLLTRRYREERSLPLVLVLDTSASMDWGEPSKLQHATVCLAALGLLALSQGDEVRVAADANVIKAIAEPLSGEASIAELCRRLAAAPAGAGEAVQVIASCAARLPRRHLLVLASDLLDADPAGLARALGASHARGHECAVLQILTRAELDLPAAWGSCAVSDPEGRSAAFACDASVAKRAYDAAIASHVEACARACAASHTDHRLCVTDEAAAATVGRWLAARKARR